jgi:hypothetical protein
MFFVPIVPSSPAPPLSPRTRELAGLLQRVLDEYTRTHPATTKAEIRAAIRMAQVRGGSDMTKVAAGLSVVLGLGVAMLLAGLFFFRAGGEASIRAISPMIIMVVIALLLVVLVVVKSQSR